MFQMKPNVFSFFPNVPNEAKCVQSLSKRCMHAKPLTMLISSNSVIQRNSRLLRRYVQICSRQESTQMKGQSKYLVRNVKIHIFWHVRQTHPRSLIRVFVFRLKKLCILDISKCAQWRFWSDCANAQADLNLRWSHMGEGTFNDAVAHLYYFNCFHSQVQTRLTTIAL